jgi:hypothetical protein
MERAFVDARDSVRLPPCLPGIRTEDAVLEDIQSSGNSPQADCTLKRNPGPLQEIEFCIRYRRMRIRKT